MKKITINFLSLTILAFALPLVASSADFTTGNLVVFRVGNGTAALNTAATPTFLEEYTNSGTLVQSIANPTTGDNMISCSGTATSEGALTLSADGKFISFTGYSAEVGTATVKGTTSATANRVIMSYDKALNLSTIKSSTAFSTDNIRCAVRNGSDYWAAGGGSIAGTNGVQYFGTGTPVQVSSTLTSIRVLNNFNGQLYFTAAPGSPGIVGLYKVGTGLPSIGGETSTVEISTAIGTSPSPYGFSMNSTSDICYVADDRSAANGGGIIKFTKTEGVWARLYTLSLGIGARGMTVDWSGSNAVIYAIGSDNKLYKIEDTASSATATVLATAATNTAFRGVSFVPHITTGVSNPRSISWTFINNTLSFNEPIFSNIEIYSLIGSKIAVYEPSRSVEIKLAKGLYILKVNNTSSKIMLN